MEANEANVTNVTNVTNGTNVGGAAPGIILAGRHISKAVSDPAFFRVMPEFSSIKAQMDTMHIQASARHGCNSCNKRRLHANIDGNFAAIAASLPDQRALVLKKYLGLSDGQKLFIRAVNPATKKVILRKF